MYRVFSSHSMSMGEPYKIRNQRVEYRSLISSPQQPHGGRAPRYNTRHDHTLTCEQQCSTNVNS